MGNSFQCVLYEEEPKCQRYEPQLGAVAMANISSCDAAAVEAVSAKAIDLSDAAGKDVTIGGTTAKQLPDVAAVGSAAASDLTMTSVEECLAACALWIPDCTHVTVGALPLSSSAEELPLSLSLSVYFLLFMWP